MHLFYISNLDSDLVELPKEEAQHCTRVLRLQTGDEIGLTDGLGQMCRAEIVSADGKSCLVRIVERQHEYQKRNYRLHVAVAPTKNTARMEWFLEKAVEIGIDELTPIICQHSERSFIKTERLEKIAVSAMKQSLKAYKPVINEPTKLSDFLKLPAEGEKFIAHCEGDERTSLKEACTADTPITVLIGPEGDFSKAEIEAAFTAGYKAITLGTSRLRTETAALASCFFVNFINE